MNLRAGAAPVDDRPDRGHPLGARADGTWRSSSRWPPSARRAGASSSSCRPLRERSRFDRHDPEPSGLRSARLSESSVDPTSVGGFLVSGSPAPAAPWLPVPAASAPSRRPWLPWLPCPWLPRSWWLRLQSRGLGPALLALWGCVGPDTCPRSAPLRLSATVRRPRPGPGSTGSSRVHRAVDPRSLPSGGAATGSLVCTRMVERLVHAGSLSSRGPRRPFGRGLRLSTCVFGRLPGFGWFVLPPGRLRASRFRPGQRRLLLALRGPGSPALHSRFSAILPSVLPLGEGVHCAFGPGAGAGASHRQPRPPPALWPRPPSSTTATWRS